MQDDVKPAHIGIVACSAEGAALCYRTICTEGPALLGARHAHPEVSMHTPSLADYTAALAANDMQAVGDLMLASAGKLAAVGAEFLICPDNTIHQAFDHVESRSPLPWLHIAGIVADAALARGCRKLGILGTCWLVDSAVYPDALAVRGLDCVCPQPVDRDEIDRIIMEELVYGNQRSESIARVIEVIGRLKGEGCDAVVLACTELPLVIDEANAPLPTLDSTRLLARAALRRAIQAGT